MSTYQVDRVYSLIVGDKDKAVEINTLQMRFNVTKKSDNSDDSNRAEIEIFNLSESMRKMLEKDYVQVRLDVGYSRIGMVNLFMGQVINISNSKITPILSRRAGPDIITKLEVLEMYTDLNHTIQNKSVPEGASVREVLNTLIAGMDDVSKGVYNGNGVERTLPDGYPIHGTPADTLRKLAATYDLEWQIDNKVLYVSDKFKSYMDDTDKVPLIGQMSGLIEAPEFVSSGEKRSRASANKNTGANGEERKDSLKLKILLNPTLIAGSYFKLEYEDLSGYYKIDEVSFRGDYRGNDWYCEVICSERI